MIRAVTPNKELAGAMFGLGQSFNAFARTFGPAFVRHALSLAHS
jgi:hypothetical protein